MSHDNNDTLKTLRVVFPQWQGGLNTTTHLGSLLLEFLAPPPSVAEQCNNGKDSKKMTTKTITIPVRKPHVGYTSQKELVGSKEFQATLKNNIFCKDELIQMGRAALEAVRRENPDKVVVFGGDCLVDLTPFAVMAEKYNHPSKRTKLGVLWLDAHPDILRPQDWRNAHTYVLGLLLHREGNDKDLLSLVSNPINSSQVMYVGLEGMLKGEKEYTQSPAERFSFISSADMKEKEGKAAIEKARAWIVREGITHLCIHLDMDVIDVRSFRSILFGNPDKYGSIYDDTSKGKLTIQEILRLTAALEAERKVDIVGMGITEHTPWDAINAQKMLYRLPVVGSYRSKL